MMTESVIMTAEPTTDPDISIVITRLPGRGEQGAQLFLDVQCKDSPAGREVCESARAQETKANFRASVGGS
jgi:hypothetical protein